MTAAPSTERAAGSPGRVVGKVAVVTGGASGIGAATVHRLVAEGATVVIADVDAERAAAVAATRPESIEARRVDITQEADVEAFVAAVVARHGHIDVLVNSAALTDPVHQARDSAVDAMPLAIWNRTLEVDLTGTMLVCRCVLPVMRAGGSIVNITSNAALAGDTSLSAYGAAKAALQQLTRSIATASGPRGIRCNAVSPAHIASPSFAANVPPAVAAALEANCLVPRLGTVDDVAAVIVFLASDESRAITGETIRVDGGALAHLPTYAGAGDAPVARA
ncbi:MAG TPA: SDR family oxidoreductase [Acidimicrobiales bacterium]